MGAGTTGEGRPTLPGLADEGGQPLSASRWKAKLEAELGAS